MDISGKILLATQVQDLVQKSHPGLRSMVVVKTAYDAIKFIEDAARTETTRVASAEESLTLNEPRPKSLLLSLPAELLHYIWELCVVSTGRDGWPTAIDVTTFYTITQNHSSDYPGRLIRRTKDGSKLMKRSSAAQPPISRICREVRQQVLPVFYSKNVFTVSVAGRAPRSGKEYCAGFKWIRDIGPENSKALRKVLWFFASQEVSRSYLNRAVGWLKQNGVSQKVIHDVKQQLTAQEQYGKKVLVL